MNGQQEFSSIALDSLKWKGKTKASEKLKLAKVKASEKQFRAGGRGRGAVPARISEGRGGGGQLGVDRSFGLWLWGGGRGV